MSFLPPEQYNINVMNSLDRKVQALQAEIDRQAIMIEKLNNFIKDLENAIQYVNENRERDESSKDRTDILGSLPDRTGDGKIHREGI